MDTSTNPGLPRKSARLFLLAAVTVLFGLLWSSDQEFQERELLAARTRAKSTPEAPLVANDLPIVRPENSASAPVAPFAVSSWIAPSFATSAAEDATREPVIATRNAAAAPSPAATVPQEPLPQESVVVAREPVVSVMVVFRRQSFRVDDAGIVDSGSQADAVGSWPVFEANCQALAKWIEQIRFEMAGRTCDMRWQLRRMGPIAGRRMLALARRQFGPELDWRVFVQSFARGGFAPVERAASNAAARHAAAQGSAEER